MNETIEEDEDGELILFSFVSIIYYLYYNLLTGGGDFGIKNESLFIGVFELSTSKFEYGILLFIAFENEDKQVLFIAYLIDEISTATTFLSINNSPFYWNIILRLG